MKRRDALKTIGVVAAAVPFGGLTQTTSRMHRVGLLVTGAPAIIADTSPFGVALIRGLERLGYSLDRNLAFERRGADGSIDLLPRLLDELVASKVDVILAISYPAALAAKKGTMLPVVVVSAGDPVGTGLVGSLARPGGNLTGVSDVAVELSPKRLELLKEIAPGLRRVAMLWNEGDPAMTLRYQASQSAAQALGIAVEPLGVRQLEDFERAFAAMAQNRPDAVFVVHDFLTGLHRRRVFDFAAANRMPALYEEEVMVRGGGLMSYGPDLGESFNRAAALIDRILKGAKPQDLPFEQPTRYRFVINLKTAKALGITIPPTLLARADDVIE
jgi:putative ABC transport system substrate-binding protein